MRMVSAVLLLCLTASALAGDISSKEAKDHVGETVTVCGAVVAAKYVETLKGQPTFLNFDEFFPNQIFTAVIWGADRAKFGAPEDTYRGRRACVTGKVVLYKNVPEIIATSPDQLKLR